MKSLSDTCRDKATTVSSSSFFYKSGNNEFNGQIVTLSLQAKNVRIVPETSRSGDNAPSHRIYVGRVDYAERGVMRSGVI